MRGRAALGALLLTGVLVAVSALDDSSDTDATPPLDDAPVGAGAELYTKGLTKLHGLEGQRQHIAQGLEMLEAAANAGSADAAYALGNHHDSPTAKHGDRARAFGFYEQAAAKGHHEAQTSLALAYESGLLVKRDVGKSVLYHYFASTAGSVPSLMALGYKHMHGLGVPKSCDTAFSYYNPAAEQVITEAQKPQGSSRFERARLSDESTEKRGRGREDEEIIEYYEYAASKGDTRAQLAMGQLLYWGARGLVQDFTQAAKWFEKAAGDIDATAPVPAASATPSPTGGQNAQAQAMSMVGHMYANGLAVEQNNITALQWFRKSHDLGFAGAANGLGYMYMHGMGVEQDYAKALEFFVAASEKGNAEAHFNLGAMYIDGIGVEQDNSKALQHFAVAAGEGHTMALYNLAVMHHNGLGTSRSCELAVQYLKNVVERGSWIATLQNASRAYDDDEPEQALWLYMLAAEEGVEMAQSNAAWLLDKGFGVGGEGGLVPSNQERYRLALHYYTLSAQQNNALSLLKLADYSYYGLGTEVDYEEAAALYMQASEMRNPQAYFNLGFMHQYGLGLPQDYHLSKRFFDMTLQASDSAAAKAPVIIALYGLKVAMWWADVKDSMPTAVQRTVDELVQAFMDWQGKVRNVELAAGGAGNADGEGGEEAGEEGSIQAWYSFVEAGRDQVAWAGQMIDSGFTKLFGGMGGGVNVNNLDTDTMLILGLGAFLMLIIIRRRGEAQIPNRGGR